jgi:hypothetical protein
MVNIFISLENNRTSIHRQRTKIHYIFVSLALTNMRQLYASKGIYIDKCGGYICAQNYRSLFFLFCISSAASSREEKNKPGRVFVFFQGQVIYT